MSRRPSHLRAEALAAVALFVASAIGCSPAQAPPPKDPGGGNEAQKGDMTARAMIAGPSASHITFERMSKFPEPGWAVPRNIAYSPDGSIITFLASESTGAEMALYAFDIATRSARVLVRASDLLKETKALSREEELRRERQRQRIAGITDYRWAKRANRLVIPFGGDLFMRDENGAISRLTDTPEPEIDPKLCASGERVAFVRGSELYAIDIATKKETKLTTGAPEGVTRGSSDFNGQEEFDEDSGFFWSPTCDRIAYLEVDERKVGVVPVLGVRADKEDLMEQRYPVAGGKNPIVRAGIIDLKSKKTTWLTFPDESERYLGRFAWSADGKALWLEGLRRDQKRVAVLRADPDSGKTTEAWSASAPTWVDFIQRRHLERSSDIVALSDEAGHTHIELRDGASGKRTAALTQGNWDVRSIAGVDEEKRLVFFIANKDAALDQQLYSVSLAGGDVTRVTEEPGVHAVHMNRLANGFVDLNSAIDRLPKASVHGERGASIGALPTVADADLDTLGIRPPELVSLPARDGTVLHGALLKPRNLEPNKRYPVVVMVYGGPTVQSVVNGYGPRLLWQHLADRGFVVFQLDNRGSEGRGHAFEAPIHKHLGDVELDDQLAGLAYLKTLPFVEGERVAIYGHSYGGYMAALAMLKAPGSFKVGIAGSPVTDWRFYDTGYTERYMETPATNAAGYAASDLAPLAKNLTGKLFILHALMDENVHFTNTAHLVDALVAANRPFDMLVFPGERHGYRSPSARAYAFHRVVDYLVDNL